MKRRAKNPKSEITPNRLRSVRGGSTLSAEEDDVEAQETIEIVVGHSLDLLK